MDNIRYEEIGYWSEIKLDIVREYAQAYSTIMAAQKDIRKYIYIDAFAGYGVHISKRTREFVLGSPLNALNVEPPFNEYHFIDMDGDKTDQLRRFTADVANVELYNEDCNEVLLRKIFPRALWRDYHRALCLLDPYKLNLSWEVVKAAGEMRSVEIFINFMVMDANRNVLRKNPDKVAADEIARMDFFWGDNSWRELLYKKEQTLFSDLELESKVTNESLAAAYRDRLKKVAGFEFVPEPIPMRNKRGAIIYYLYFASPNKTGPKIVRDIFDKYRIHGAR
jgi:three-Cys-motif partner protein